MKLLIKLILFSTAFFFLTGCECFPVRKGIILDELTHLPIENAQIKFGTANTLSNNIGQFEISGSSCDLKLIVSKKNYKPFAAKLSTKNEKVKIELDDEIIYTDLDKPKYLKSDSLSYLVVEAENKNSVHFEFLGGTDSMKIYLTKFNK